jgi:hypothetical protein
MKKLIHKLAVKTRLIYFWRLFRNVKRRGFKNSLRYLFFKISTLNIVLKLRERSLKENLIRILEENNEKPILLSLSFVDWNIPLYQRPQHIAIQLAKKRFLYFYNTRNYYDYMDGYKKIGENMYLTNRFDDVLEEVKGRKDVYIHLYSTNMYEEDNERIKKALEYGFKIVYEYIDEISEKISGGKIPAFVYERHERLLKDEENVYVIATATKLYNDVAKYRKNNFQLVTNGVVYEHFVDIENTVPKEMKDIVNNGKPIIGYYGALASWFDYKMVGDVANMRKDWNIVLIGWDYDGSFANSGLKKLENVFVIPSIEYMRLPLYAQWFDVCTIPFKLNEVTESTSPVKLFEYMALGKPIVTTSMPECRKYKSVLISMNTGKDFVSKIEEGLRDRKNKKYMEILKKEALENTWESKAEEISKLIIS